MQVDWTIYLTFLGAGLILLLPRDSKNLIRWIALLTGVGALLVALKNYFDYNAWVNAEIAAHGALQDGFQHIVNVSWVPALNVNYHLAVDGISYPLIVLNGFVCVTGILFSWNIENRVKEFFAFFLTLIAGVYGVFMAMDFFLLFVFYELAIIPKYFVIAIWGSTRKEYGAMKRRSRADPSRSPSRPTCARSRRRARGRRRSRRWADARARSAGTRRAPPS